MEVRKCSLGSCEAKKRVMKNKRMITWRGWSTINLNQFLVLMASDRRVTASAPASGGKEEPLSSREVETEGQSNHGYFRAL
jgi:hypothetical protein